jgi:hypothetical protein
VKALELTAPGAYRADREHLYGQLRGGKIFSAFNEQEREAIWEKVLSISSDRLIPSFYSYFEDINYFQGPVKCVKSLLELSPRDSVSSALLRAFRDGNRRVNQYVVQESESRFVVRPGDLSDGEDIALRQIWIIAMRYSEAKLDWKPSKATLCEIATQAYRLGFKSTPILNLFQGSADRQIARKALLEARRPDRFKYDAAAFEEHIEQMVRFFSTAEALTEEEARNIHEADNDGRPPKRCGVPKPKDHEQDKLSLFLDKLHDTNEQPYPDITSFFVRRSVYFAFWGKTACIVNHDTAHERVPEQEILESETEETRDFTRQQRLAQPAEQERRRQQQAEQERERQRQVEEEHLARLVEERRAKETLLARLVEQTRAEEERLAQLTEQRQAEEGGLAQLAEKRQAEEGRLVQLTKQSHTEEGRLVQLIEQRQSEEGWLAQLAEERQRRRGGENRIAAQETQWQVEEERRRQNEEDLFEGEELLEDQEMFEEQELVKDEKTQKTRTRRRRPEKAQPGDKILLASQRRLDGEKKKKPKRPRGIGALRKEKNRKRLTQIDFRESLSHAQAGSGKQTDALTNDANLVKDERQQLVVQDKQEQERLAEEAERQRQAEEAEKQRLLEEAEKQRQVEEAEKQRLLEEAEKQRQAEEAEKQRQAEEAERQRLLEEAEKQRQAEEAEKQRLLEWAEKQRQAEEAEKQRQAEEAEKQRLLEEAEKQRQAEEAEKQRLLEEAEKQRQAEEAEKQRLLEEAERQRQAEEEREKEVDIQKTRTSTRGKYLAKAQPDRGSLASLWNLDRERTYKKKPKPPKGIGAARKENDRKQITQINLGEVIEPATQRRAEKNQVELG